MNCSTVLNCIQDKHFKANMAIDEFTKISLKNLYAVHVVLNPRGVLILVH